MLSDVVVSSPRVFSATRRLIFNGWFVIAGGNALMYIGLGWDGSMRGVLLGNACFLWLVFCATRLVAYSTAGMVVIHGGRIRVFDCTLKDLGEYDVADVGIEPSRRTGCDVKVPLRVPDLGRIDLVLAGDAGDEEYLRRTIPAAGGLQREGLHATMAVSVLVALTCIPVVIDQLLREGALASSTITFGTALAVLLSCIAYLRLKKQIRIMRLMRGVL